MGCRCNCLVKNPESDNEIVDGVIPGLGIRSSHKDNFEIVNINTENDNEEDNDNNNINEKDKQNNNDIINESINENLSDKLKYKENEDNNRNNSISLKDGEKMSEKNEALDKLKITNAQTGLSRNTPRRIISYDSSVISKIQELSENIFDYFNEIRTKPDNFEKISEDHEVSDIIRKVINASNPCTNLIINNFYNLLLSSYINDYTNDGEENNKLLEQIEKEEKLKNFDKKLYSVEGDINNPNEVVWKLIKNNKDIAFDTFFSNNIECLVISCQMINNQKFNSYFLFLSKRN